MTELDKLREIFLADDVDEETRKENAEKIQEWEAGILINEATIGWRDHDITKQIAQQCKEAYKDLAMTLATNRTLTEQQRYSLWGKQDACLFILSLTEVDAKSALDQIHSEIRTALKAT